MWIFTPIGFFSVVTAHKNQPDHVMVRARAPEDLLALIDTLDRYCDSQHDRDDLDIIHTMKADYPCRIIVRRELFANWLHDAIMGLDYDNFKDTVAGTNAEGSRRAHGPYLEVWTVLARSIDCRRPGARQSPRRSAPTQPPGVRLDPRSADQELSDRVARRARAGR